MATCSGAALVASTAPGTSARLLLAIGDVDPNYGGLVQFDKITIV